jgi:hypothetical protein
VTPRTVRRVHVHVHVPTTLYGPAGNAAVTLLCGCYVQWGILKGQTPARDIPRRRTTKRMGEGVRSNG